MNRERKKWLIIAASLLAVFIIYYLVMSVLAVSRAVNEFDDAYFASLEQRRETR